MESKGLQVCPRAHPLRPETPSLPACSLAAAGGFTVNKTTAENDFSSGRKKKKGRGWGGGGKKQPLFQCSYPLSKQHILLQASIRSPNGETAISRQLSSRQGAMPTRCRTERGRERQSWCQLEPLTPLSRPCSCVSKCWQGHPCAQR